MPGMCFTPSIHLVSTLKQQLFKDSHKVPVVPALCSVLEPCLPSLLWALYSFLTHGQSSSLDRESLSSDPRFFPGFSKEELAVNLLHRAVVKFEHPFECKGCIEL